MAQGRLAAVDEKLTRLEALRDELVRLMNACEPTAPLRERQTLHALNDPERYACGDDTR